MAIVNRWEEEPLTSVRDDPQPSESLREGMIANTSSHGTRARTLRSSRGISQTDTMTLAVDNESRVRLKERPTKRGKHIRLGEERSVPPVSALNRCCQAYWTFGGNQR